MGINPIPSFHPSWRESDGASYSTYIEALTELACASLRDGHEVVLYSTHARDDSGAMDDIVEGVAGHLGSRAADDIAAPAVASLDDVWNTISGLRWVVASRYHGVITALMMGKPTLALAYRRKTSDLAKMLGLEETCIPIPHVTAGNLLDRFGRLTADDAKFAAAARRGVRSLRSRIDGQFDMVCERARG